MSGAPTEDISVEFGLRGSSFAARGPAEQVFHALDRFERLIAASAARTSNDDGNDADADEDSQDTGVDGTGGASSNGAGSNAEKSGATSGDKLPLKVFLRQRKLPRGNPGIALGIAVWATRFEAATDLTVEQFRTYWGKAGEKWPANPVRDLRRAAQEGWLDEPAERVFRLADFGESTFEDLETVTPK